MCLCLCLCLVASASLKPWLKGEVENTSRSPEQWKMRRDLEDSHFESCLVWGRNYILVGFLSVCVSVDTGLTSRMKNNSPRNLVFENSRRRTRVGPITRQICMGLPGRRVASCIAIWVSI